jgi:acylphosphatase
VVRVRAVVSGMVQGVFFRQATAEHARRLGVAGWVRNRPDGRVEAVFEGSQDVVDQMVSWCHEGTPWSNVEQVEVTAEEPEGLDAFRIR